MEDKERDELVRTVRRFSTEAFGSDLNCQVASSWATDVGHPELKFKSIGFSKKLMDIKIHENSDVLVLEFREKK